MACYVLMGVSGCGKSSVGAELSKRCGVQSIDGDDLHPPSNIEKMSSGLPLNDADRGPWLVMVGQALAHASGPIVIGCSALRKKYRDTIRAQLSDPVHFLHLSATQEVLATRVAGRAGHFMPKTLLDSQFAALEPLQPDELGCEIDIARPISEVFSETERYVLRTMTPDNAG